MQSMDSVLTISAEVLKISITGPRRCVITIKQMQKILKGSLNFKLCQSCISILKICDYGFPVLNCFKNILITESSIIAHTTHKL